MTIPHILIRQCTVMILYLSLLGLTAHFWYLIIPRFSLKQSTQVWISPGRVLYPGTETSTRQTHGSGCQFYIFKSYNSTALVFWGSYNCTHQLEMILGWWWWWWSWFGQNFQGLFQLTKRPWGGLGLILNIFQGKITEKNWICLITHQTPDDTESQERPSRKTKTERETIHQNENMQLWQLGPDIPEL